RTRPPPLAQLRPQAPEPLRVARGVDPDQRQPRRAGVKSLRCAVLVLQPARYHLAGLRIQHGNDLVARMQITSDNQHAFGSFLRQPWSRTNQVYRSEGADAVI